MTANAGGGSLKADASPNFSFLGQHDALLVRYAAQAERYVFEDPNTALVKLRQLAELLAKRAAAYAGVAVESEVTFSCSLSMTWGLFPEPRRERD